MQIETDVPKVPKACDIGLIPDYFAPIYTKIVNEYLPAYLSRETSYLIIGGRAFNLYMKRQVPSVDWDIVLQGDVEMQSRFSSNISNYLNTRLRGETNWVSIVQAITNEKIPIDQHYLFRVSIIDPYSQTEYQVVDIHTCYTSENKLDYCDYMNHANVVDGIRYAPLSVLKADLLGIFKKRYSLYTASKKYVKKQQIETMGDELHETLDDLYDHDVVKKHVELRKMIAQFSEDFYEYESLLCSDIDSESLLYREYIKYKRTKDRYDALFEH